MSGTGKTAIAELLDKKGVHSISIDEVEGLCVWRNKISDEVVEYEAELNEDFIKAHDWICDVDYLQKLMSKKEGVVVVLGSASNQKEYLALFDEVLLLQCKPETFIERIKQRKDNIFGKDESAQKLILSWYKDFEDNLLKNGAIAVDANKPLATIVDEIMARIE